MQFYKIDAIAKETLVGEEIREARRQMLKYRFQTEMYNQKFRSHYVFISENDENAVTFGILTDDEVDVSEAVVDFSKFLGIDIESHSIEELTIGDFGHILNNADRANFIDDDDKVIDKFGLDMLSSRRYRGAYYGESIINIEDKRSLYREAEFYLVNNTLIPEYNRIYTKVQETAAFGHPVHYMIMTDSHQIRKSVYKNLLSALYSQGRLKSRRYSYINICDDDVREASARELDNLYRVNKGGSIVIRCIADEIEEDDLASSERESIAIICKMIKRYRNDVLTIICLPRECSKVRTVFEENLGNMCFVDIKEETVGKARAVKFLKKFADKKHIKADKNLYGRLEENGSYFSNDLTDLFEEWYNGKIKNSVFPQYKDIANIEQVIKEKEVAGDAYTELQEMIGLDSAKDVMDKALNYYKMQKIYRSRGMSNEQPAMHMTFMGNPGTAKTTAARLFARIMKDNGILSHGHLIEVGRSDLVGRYVGWTAKTVKEKFQQAIGGVLFIDEAYSLVDDRSGSFGDEAINTIVQEMENHRDEMIVIFAGYPDKMEEFINKNPGLRSRIAFHVTFDDYNTEELCDIAQLMSKKMGIKLTDGAMKKLSPIFEEARKNSDYGNGRYVRNTLDMARMNQASRLLKLDMAQITDDAIRTITEDDIEKPKDGNVTEVKTHIGFCA